MKERSMTMAAKIARPCWTVFQVGGRALKYSRKRPVLLASEVVALVLDEADMVGASVEQYQSAVRASTGYVRVWGVRQPGISRAQVTVLVLCAMCAV